MPSTAAFECKKLCLFRCLSAIVLSMLMQFLLLTVFLLFINFHILQPIQWISQTIGLMLSFTTWLSIIPLLSAILFYGILLGKSQLAARMYYQSRFRWFLGNVIRKLAFLSAHVIVGFLTAWLYTRFLHVDYKYFFIQCFGADCLSSRYVFLINAGIVASIYHFIRKHLRNEPEVEFPIISELKLVQIRSLLYTTLYKSLLKSFLPTLGYAAIYWLFGGWINGRLANVFGVERDEILDSLFTIASSWRLLFYTWILTSQIISNMHLMQNFFSIFLSSPYQFIIEKNPMLADGAQTELTLVEALSMEQAPVIQNLAALQLYNIAQQKDTTIRRQIFSLSVPGGHPNNWNDLASQILCLLNAFIDELAASVKNISTVKSAPLFTTIKPSASEAAEKILLRQYNETYGIRRLMAENACNDANSAKVTSTKQTNPANAVQRINEQFDQISRQIEQTLRTAFRTIPGLYYMFGEPEGAKTAFLLSNCQAIVWLTQGISGICAASLVEDKYGVVQVMLPQIIKTLLRLKLELDKLNNVNLNGKKLDRNLITLRSAVKRSLYKICTVFGDYLRELVEDHEDYRHLQCFDSYQET